MNRTILALGSLVLLAGCGGKSSGPSPMSLSFSFVIAPGEEKTQCLVAKLPNDRDYDFSRVDSHMTPGSHHLILYRDASDLLPGTTAPSEGVQDCDMGAARLFVYTTQEQDHFVEMPEGVAGTLRKHQLVILEAHYVNASTEPLTANIDLTLTPADSSKVKEHAGIMFYLDTDFRIPAGAGMNGSPTYTHSTSCAVPPGINIFRLGSHTHKRGTDVQVFKTKERLGDMSMVYENTDWSKPLEKDYAGGAPLTINQGDGFRFACSWTNETDHEIKFGESVEDEMCIIGAGFYPVSAVAGGPYALDGNVVCFDGELYY